MRPSSKSEGFTTFSVSVSPKTKKALKRIATRRYAGSVSALIETVALQAERLDALALLLEDAPPVDDQAYHAFLAELHGPKRKRAARKSGKIAA
jgi:hypothetical protein